VSDKEGLEVLEHFEILRQKASYFIQLERWRGNCATVWRQE